MMFLNKPYCYGEGRLALVRYMNCLLIIPYSLPLERFDFFLYHNSFKGTKLVKNRLLELDISIELVIRHPGLVPFYHAPVEVIERILLK